MVHFGKTKIKEMCECQYFYLCAIFLFKKSFAYNFVLYTVLHYFLKKSLSSLFFMNTVVHYLIFFTNCCPSEIIVLLDIFYLLFIKLSQMHRLKCRNCLMFVTTNIRVLYVHWNECVRKKEIVKCILTAIVLGLCRYFF